MMTQPIGGNQCHRDAAGVGVESNAGVVTDLVTTPAVFPFRKCVEQHNRGLDDKDQTSISERR